MKQRQSLKCILSERFCSNTFISHPHPLDYGISVYYLAGQKAKGDTYEYTEKTKKLLFLDKASNAHICLVPFMFVYFVDFLVAVVVIVISTIGGYTAISLRTRL